MATWHIDLVTEPAAIVVRIVGSIEAADATDAAERTSAMLRRLSTDVEVCIDLRQMVDYTVSARDQWSAVLKEHKPKIRMLTWVTTKSTQRMVGRAVGLFTGLTTRLLDELPPEFAARR
ncbi:MAG: hypothetical protein JNK45_06130 [Myxococcales bacterium]|nr:hypothetical protein [Myxococcales bacterium]